MNGWEILASFVFGLLVNEMTDLSPWAARKLVQWAAYRWTTDRDIAAGYADEWTAIIEDRPGKLFKLITALQFAIGAIGRAAPRLLADSRDAATRIIMELTNLLEGVALDMSKRELFVSWATTIFIFTTGIVTANWYLSPEVARIVGSVVIVAAVGIPLAYPIRRYLRRR